MPQCFVYVGTDFTTLREISHVPRAAQNVKCKQRYLTLPILLKNDTPQRKPEIFMAGITTKSNTKTVPLISYATFFLRLYCST